MTNNNRPHPKKNSECEGCRKTRPLLIAVGYAPGWPCIAWRNLCLKCRLELKIDNDPQYCWYIEDMIHSKEQRARAAFDEWKDISPDDLTRNE